MNILDKIEGIANSTDNQYLAKAREKGTKVLGYLCSYVPEEIIHAAGFIPYRMRAVESKGTTKGDIYYSPINCTFVRHCFDKAMQGDFDFLDGIIFMNGCDHARRMYDNWRDAGKNYGIGPSFLYMFVAPHIISKSAVEEYSVEIKRLIDALEENYKVEISEENIKASIELDNKKRGLLIKINEKRKSLKPSVKGSEMLSLAMAVSAVPVEDGIELLTEFDEFTENRELEPGKIRVLLGGGCIEEVEHLKMIEESGADIAADYICLGQRFFKNNIVLSDNPLFDIADKYLRHTSCPRMINDLQNRLEYIDTLIDEYSIDAVIVEKLKFCSLWGGETFVLKSESKKRGYPLLILERELYGSSEGQLKTRIQAFFEMLKN